MGDENWSNWSTFRVAVYCLRLIDWFKRVNLGRLEMIVVFGGWGLVASTLVSTRQFWEVAVFNCQHFINRLMRDKPVALETVRRG